MLLSIENILLLLQWKSIVFISWAVWLRRTKVSLTSYSDNFCNLLRFTKLKTAQKTCFISIYLIRFLVIKCQQFISEKSNRYKKNMSSLIQHSRARTHTHGNIFWQIYVHHISDRQRFANRNLFHYKWDFVLKWRLHDFTLLIW